MMSLTAGYCLSIKLPGAEADKVNVTVHDMDVDIKVNNYNRCNSSSEYAEGSTGYRCMLSGRYTSNLPESGGKDEGNRKGCEAAMRILIYTGKGGVGKTSIGGRYRCKYRTLREKSPCYEYGPGS